MRRAVAVATCLLVACVRTTLEGVVVDPSGGAVPGATVVGAAAGCAGLTDARGAFFLPCGPGSHLLSVSADGHHDAEVAVHAPEGGAVIVEPIELFPRAPGDGLWRLDGAALVELEPGVATRRRGARAKAYCVIPEQSPANAVVGGALRLLDRGAAPWKLFRLDAEGCAQRMEWRTGAWRVVASDEPEPAITPVDDSRLFRFHLDPGDYFLTDWTTGRFVAVAEGEDPPASKRYAGARFVVR